MENRLIKRTPVYKANNSLRRTINLVPAVLHLVLHLLFQVFLKRTMKLVQRVSALQRIHCIGVLVMYIFGVHNVVLRGKDYVYLFRKGFE